MEGVRNYSSDPTHVHESIRDCAICWPIYHRQVAKHSYNTVASDPVRYAAYLERERVRHQRHRDAKPKVCKACGEPRESGTQFCNACIEAFRSWSNIKSYNKRKREDGVLAERTTRGPRVAADVGRQPEQRVDVSDRAA